MPRKQTAEAPWPWPQHDILGIPLKDLVVKANQEGQAEKQRKPSTKKGQPRAWEKAFTGHLPE